MSTHANTAKENPLGDQWPKILAAHKEHFVPTLIERHLAEELHTLTPDLQTLLEQTSGRLKALKGRDGLAYCFLDEKRGGGLGLEQLVNFVDTISERLRSELYDETGSSLISDQWTGKTKGNRKQVELTKFVVSIASILKDDNGIPWSKVQMAIQLLAEADPRLKKVADLYISNGYQGKQALRSLYNRAVST